MSENILIYGRAGWPYTDKARSAYGNKAEFIDVTADREKLSEMLKLSKGRREVPVIVESDKVTVGYGGSWGVWFLQAAGGTSYELQVVNNLLLVTSFNPGYFKHSPEFFLLN